MATLTLKQQQAVTSVSVWSGIIYESLYRLSQEHDMIGELHNGHVIAWLDRSLSIARHAKEQAKTLLGCQ